MKSLFVIVIIITISLFSANVKADSSSIIIANRNDTLTFGSTTEGVLQISTFDITLRRNADLNSDGDISDVDEDTLLINNQQTQTCINMELHLACNRFDNNRIVVLIWKNTSSFRQVGNFTLVITLRNAVDQIIGISIHSIVMNGDHLNHTEQLQLFTTNCHSTGTNLCINGHTPNIVTDEVLTFLAMLVIMGLILFFSVQRGYVIPMISSFLATALLFFIISFAGQLFTSQLVETILILMAAIIPLVGPINMLYRFYLMSRVPEGVGVNP